jgi:hypothetical protein
MKQYLLLIGFTVFAFLFFIVNRGAYRGFFDGDDLDNIARGIDLRAGEVARATGNPVLKNSFRAAGLFMFFALAPSQRLNYRPYVTWIHATHLLTVLIVFFLLRRLGFSTPSAVFGTLFFGFNMAVFDIYWKPMFVLDLTCGLFCALAILAWLYDRWLISLLCFWLAFKCKEIAVMLPFVLLTFELTMGRRHWLKLLPFFVLSIAVIAQAAIANKGPQTAYTFHFTPEALVTTTVFYAPLLIALPMLVFACLALYNRSRALAAAGVATFLLFLAPLLFLPNRMNPAYLYVPLIGLSMLAAAALRSVWIAAIFFAVWLPWNFVEMRHKRVPLIAEQRENRSYVNAIADFIAKNGVSNAYVYDHDPDHINSWGVEGLIHILAPQSKTYSYDDALAGKIFSQPSLTMMRWHPELKKVVLALRNPDTAFQPYLIFGPETPEWQLSDGWWGYEGMRRWTKATATALLDRSPTAKVFELKALIAPQLIESGKQVHVDLSIDGKDLGTRAFTNEGWQLASWPLSEHLSGVTKVALNVSPTYQGAPDGSHPMGIAVTEFGFK